MSRSKGKRYTEEEPKLNFKKVFATILTIIVLIMVFKSLKNILISETSPKDVSMLTNYYSAFENDKWGVIDNNGEIIIPTTSEEMYVIPDPVKDIFISTVSVNYVDESYDTKVVNKENKEIFTEYNNVEAIENSDYNNIWFEKNVLRYKDNDKYGLIDFNGNVILKPQYNDIYALKGIQNSIIIVKDGKLGLFNPNSEQIIIDPEYSEIKSLTNNYENGYIVKNLDNKYGIISIDKKNVLEFKYDDIKNVTGSNLYVVNEAGVLKIVDNKGKDVIEKLDYNNVLAIEGDKLIVSKDNKLGLILKDGKQIIEPKYDDLKFGSNGSYIAKENGLYKIIDENQKDLSNTYLSIAYIKEASFYQAEKENYKTDIIDRDNDVVLNDVIVSELNIEDGYLRIRENQEYKYYNFKLKEKTNKEMLSSNTLFLVKENGKYGYENKNNEKIVDCIYDDAKEQNKNGYCVIKKDGLYGVLKSDGTILVEPSINLDNNIFIDFIGKWHLMDDGLLNYYTK